MTYTLYYTGHVLASCALQAIFRERKKLRYILRSTISERMSLFICRTKPEKGCHAKNKDVQGCPVPAFSGRSLVKFMRCAHFVQGRGVR